jgi:type IV secretory pathway TraG/TraD family ATPase VirD4
MIAFIRFFLGKSNDSETPEWTFLWGCIEVFGKAMRWRYAMLTLGVCIVGGTGVGKTRRLLLALLESLLALRITLPESERWAALVLDPKLSFAQMFVERAAAYGQSDQVYVLDGEKNLRINPLRSGLPAEKIAEILNASVLAGLPVVRSSGGQHYEDRAITVLTPMIRLAQLSSDQSLKFVSEMADALSAGISLSCNHPDGQEALQRIETFLLDDERERKAVLSTIHKILEPFRANPWRKIFFEGGPYNLDTARDAGWILVCAFSPNQTPKLNTGLYLLKQLWFSAIMARMDKKINCNRERYCLYVCDEFQQICGRNSEADFFAVRREALGCPIVAFQQISQIRSALGDEWQTVLGLLSSKIFLRNPDPDTCLYAEKLGGQVDTISESHTRILETGSVQYQAKSQTLSTQTRPRMPADYLSDLPDGDAVVFDQRKLFWFPALGMTLAQEKTWRKARWPNRPRLKSPREDRA